MSKKQYDYIVNITLGYYFQLHFQKHFTGSYMCVAVAQCNFVD